MAGGKYDFVVLGGGHNGLLTTIYLAKAGFKVCCLEALDEFGGGTRSGEVIPGYVADMGGMVHNMISKTPIVREDELGLFSKYGFEYCYLDSLFCSIFPDNTNLVMTKDIDESCNNIAKFSEKDAVTYRKFHDYMVNMLNVAGIGSQSPPPAYGAMMNVMSMSPEGREFQRVLNSSSQQIVEEWFESEQVRVTFTRWCTEMMIDPRAIGTASLLYFTAGLHDPDNPGAPFPKGGCINFVNALVACAEDNGADLFLNAWVDDITVEGGEVKSVRTKNGDEFFAENAVVSTIHIADVFEMLGDDAPADDSHYVKLLKHCDFAALNQAFALDTIPEFKTGPEVLNTFCIEAAPWEPEYLETFSTYTLGKFNPKLPLITIPSLHDPTRCPEGHSVVNVYSYAPWNLYGDWRNWEKHGDELKKQVWDFFKSMTTNITDDNVLGKWGLTPLEYQEWDPAFHEGDIGQIGMQPSQMYDMRPIVGKGHEYHGDIENLYFLGSSSHPGGGIAAGARAGVQKVLEDYGVDFRDVIRK
ncbi:phytoene desaturase family protein [Gordonibacter massiliensis (ex Traore et al. 2017)]|uniref:NAD(P)/FAD-dependent oxidoreductase n=1 Tax=Gordonibacter massiliensis (ex Traore et al. 2017) TaxID=1841863 RepID=A0A842JFD3_9ACTN|nr:NAD(P)/FAD-dependent oxidoreductase [Gordonibacter massiliensis (ex Traore et al. 2017)]MBC2888039.1 NAD(P)/FAD-dependent oxidoreductase [Gordonibacter massiliensis (ex Traore et al. 2017)]